MVTSTEECENKLTRYPSAPIVNVQCAVIELRIQSRPSAVALRNSPAVRLALDIGVELVIKQKSAERPYLAEVGIVAHIIVTQEYLRHLHERFVNMLTPAPHGCVSHALRCDPSRYVHVYAWTHRDRSQRKATEKMYR